MDMMDIQNYNNENNNQDMEFLYIIQVYQSQNKTILS
jgi:hypothetical protein